MNIGRLSINRAIKSTGLTLMGERGEGVYRFVNEQFEQVGPEIMLAYLNQFTIERWIEEANERAKGI